MHRFAVDYIEKDKPSKARKASLNLVSSGTECASAARDSVTKNLPAVKAIVARAPSNNSSRLFIFIVIKVFLKKSFDEL